MDGREFTRDQTLNTQNNLDICFDSIFESKLRFQIDKDDKRFIRTGVKKILKKLVRAIEDHGWLEKNMLIYEFLQKHPEHDFVCHGAENRKKILMVGSFPEGTKNMYPDEFDFIYVICTFKVSENFEDKCPDWLKHYFTLNRFHETIKNILTKLIDTDKLNYLGVSFVGYSKNQGPASKLKFKYKINESANTDEKEIFVDIVPAFRIIDKHLTEKVGAVCNVKGFAEEIVQTGSYFITNEVSFTLTEVSFMRNKLSPTHKMAYRILKYIFNGDKDGEQLRNNVAKAGISTYMIKVSVIHHHFICDGNTRKPAQCVLTILEDIRQFCIDYENNDDPKLKKFNGGEFEMQSDNVEHTIKYLEKMILELTLLKFNAIETEDIKPISKSIHDCIRMQTSIGQISANNSRRQSFSSRCSTVLTRREIGLETRRTTSPYQSDEETETPVNTQAINPKNSHIQLARPKVSSGRSVWVETGRLAKTLSDQHSLPEEADRAMETNLQNVVVKHKTRITRCCSLM